MHLLLRYLWLATWVAIILADIDATEFDAQDKDSVRPRKGYAFGIPGKNASFDYVIVGGGTAGLTLATRLAANPSISIAVIEAGGFYEADVGNTSIVPGYDALYTGRFPSDTNPLIDWGFTTTPQTVCIQVIYISCTFY